MDGHQLSLAGESSAIDLAGTPARIAGSVPSSPTLTPAESRGSFARRRTSWGRVDISQDPLRFDLSTSVADAATYLVQSCSDVRPNDKLDAFDFCLYKHDTEVLVFGGVRVGAQQFNIASLVLDFMRELIRIPN